MPITQNKYARFWLYFFIGSRFLQFFFATPLSSGKRQTPRDFLVDLIFPMCYNIIVKSAGERDELSLLFHDFGNHFCGGA